MPIGHDGRLVLVAFTGSSDAPVDAHLEVVLAALDEAATRPGRGAVDLGVVLEGAPAARYADRLRDRHLLVVPADDPTQDRFALVDGDGFGAAIEQLAPDLTAVRLRWHPDDEPEVKKGQALGLTRLAAWLHETDRSLVIDLAVVATEADLAAVDGDPDRFARELRPERTRDAIVEIRDLGVEADLWAVDARAADLDELAAVVVDAGRDHVGFLVRSGGAADAPGVATPAGAGAAAYRGVVVEPGRWAAELAALDRGDADRASTVAVLAADLSDLSDLSDRTAAPPA